MTSLAASMSGLVQASMLAPVRTSGLNGHQALGGLPGDYGERGMMAVSEQYAGFWAGKITQLHNSVSPKYLRSELAYLSPSLCH
jgi:hypothetical protein